jgi:hypothetical protein
MLLERVLVLRGKLYIAGGECIRPMIRKVPNEWDCGDGAIVAVVVDLYLE